jgi:hypothetical protein
MLSTRIGNWTSHMDSGEWCHAGQRAGHWKYADNSELEKIKSWSVSVQVRDSIWDFICRLCCWHWRLAYYFCMDRTHWKILPNIESATILLFWTQMCLNHPVCLLLYLCYLVILIFCLIYLFFDNGVGVYFNIYIICANLLNTALTNWNKSRRSRWVHIFFRLG